MSCLALALQPSNGPNILLQTREWFPPARALVAVSAFRQTRLSFASGKHQSSEDGDSSLGDDPLAASSGQVIVGVESKYRVVYRLVNAIFVLGITTVDHQDSVNNVFECIAMVNQAVSVIVAACRGVDVTPEKLSKKYAEVYVALDIVLRGVGNIRLAAMLASMHGEGIAKMVHSSVDSENRIRGADNWVTVEFLSHERQSGIESFSVARFELPPEALEAGDEFMATIAEKDSEKKKEDDSQGESESESKSDPFAASDAVNKREDELVEGFKKTKEKEDLTLALAGLEITLPAVESTFISVEGFEGDYGGIEFGTAGDEASLNETFEGFHEAFGGGLDASEFVGTEKIPKTVGLAGLELLQTTTTPEKTTVPTVEGTVPPLETKIKRPEVYIHESISVEFRESLAVRVALKGTVYLKTPSGGDGETGGFALKIEGTGAVKRFVMENARASCVGNDGVFRVRSPPASEDQCSPVFKYSLLPHLTPIPLRVRLLTRHSGTLLSFMIQYVSNPDIPSPLLDVVFSVKLPVDPSLLKVSPTAVLDRDTRELQWVVDEIPLNGLPGCLRAQMAIDAGMTEEDVDVVGLVRFSSHGTRSLSGISISSVSEGMMDFHVADHTYETGVYICN